MPESEAPLGVHVFQKVLFGRNGARLCKAHGCRARVFTKEHGSLKKKLGCPDLLILFIGTVSHKMVISVTQEAKRNRIPVKRVHTSSASALKAALAECRAAV